ncbi:MAG: universal stress protein [Polyangiaceae bacterium]|nr:universal stress protein [Polyangiaceae bacterium]
MLVFAYDGSLNGDWVAHYAVRFAANLSPRRLRLVHVRDAVPVADLDERLLRIADECRVLGVELETELVARAGRAVADVLLELVPARATLVAGTRARPRNLAYLRGTVPAALLAAGRFSVIALRVVHPGVLGQPDRVLVPFSGRPSPAASALVPLGLLAGDLHHLHVLFVRAVSRLRYRVLTSERVERLVAEGRAYLGPIEAALRDGLAPHRIELDSTVVVSDDAPKEILLHAARVRARLICLGASARSLPQRLVYGNPIEQILREALSDVAIYRSVP